MSVEEILAVLLAIVYLVLASGGQRWCWPAGIASSLLYVFICYRANLLIEAALQVFYVGAGIAGWLQWKPGHDSNSTKPRNWSRGEALRYFGISISLSLMAGFLFSRYTQTSYPWLDAGISVFSITCTLLVVKKIIQNWPIWIVIDLAAAYLYARRGLELSAGLYLLYCIIAIIGWKQWTRKD